MLFCFTYSLSQEFKVFFFYFCEGIRFFLLEKMNKTLSKEALNLTLVVMRCILCLQ